VFNGFLDVVDPLVGVLGSGCLEGEALVAVEDADAG
jgi:hypothetical protein